MAATQGGDLQQCGNVGPAPFQRGQPVVELQRKIGREPLRWRTVARLYLVENPVMKIQRGHIALVDELFLGLHVVIEAGFGQPQVFRNIL